jgi:hypothetical protein
VKEHASTADVAEAASSADVGEADPDIRGSEMIAERVTNDEALTLTIARRV